MLLDERTTKLLDWERMLSELHPITPFGAKCKNAMKAFSREEKQQLQEELDRIETLVGLVQNQRTVFIELKAAMRQVKDIRKSIDRCMSGGILNQVELFELKTLNNLFTEIAKAYEKLHWEMPNKYRVYALDWLDEILDPEDTGLKTFYIYDSYSDKLTNIRLQKISLEQELDFLRKEQAAKAEEELAMPVRAAGEITISKSQADLLEKFRHSKLLHQTGENYIYVTFKIRASEEMLDLAKEIEYLKEEESLEEMQILEHLSMKIAVQGKEILHNMDALGEFDLLLAKAYLAIAQNAVKPELSDAFEFDIQNGRHPILEARLKKSNKTFTPISVRFSQGVALITGANMGGKTVSLKLFGLLAVMAQYGLLVPADYMKTGLFDFIFVSAGDEQSIDLGLSTFGAEIKSINEILKKTEQRGLLLIDELARGTNPSEGAALSAAIINFLIKKPCVSVITTHFDGLAENNVRHLQVAGLKNIEAQTIEPQDLAHYMDYHLIEVQGKVDVPRDAINISRLLGMPEEILKEAEERINKA